VTKIRSYTVHVNRALRRKWSVLNTAPDSGADTSSTYLLFVSLDQGSDDAEAGEAQVLERTGLEKVTSGIVQIKNSLTLRTSLA
jgi:hypothetical protein